MSVKLCQILFLTIIYLRSIGSQIWSGEFLVNSTCPAGICCCPSDIIYITSVSENKISLNISITGSQCFGLNGHYIENIMTPTGYNLTAHGYIVIFSFILSTDNNSLVIQSTYGSRCSVQSTRILTTNITNPLPNNNAAQFDQYNRVRKSFTYLFFFIFSFIIILL